MNNLNELWPLVLQAHQAILQPITPKYRSEFHRLRHRFQTDDPGLVGHFIYLIENFDPYHLSVEAYQRRDPFDHPQVVAGFLRQAAELGWLTANDDGSYSITEQGQAIRQLRWRIINPLLAKQRPLPTADMEYLLAKLQHIVQAIATAPKPPDQWAIRTRRNHGLRPLSGSAPLLWFAHYRMDLGAYRDDAHLAAWRSVHQITPLAWEMLGMLWTEQADSAKTLAQQLGRRGFPPADHTAAITDLKQRGWIVLEDNGRCRLTDEGQKIREAAEFRTNSYFYAPWTTANDREILYLYNLLAQLA